MAAGPPSWRPGRFATSPQFGSTLTRYPCELEAQPFDSRAGDRLDRRRQPEVVRVLADQRLTASDSVGEDEVVEVKRGAHRAFGRRFANFADVDRERTHVFEPEEVRESADHVVGLFLRRGDFAPRFRRAFGREFLFAVGVVGFFAVGRGFCGHVAVRRRVGIGGYFLPSTRDLPFSTSAQNVAVPEQSALIRGQTLRATAIAERSGPDEDEPVHL